MMQLNENELSMVHGGADYYTNFCYYCDKPTVFMYMDEPELYEPGTVVRCTECKKIVSKVFADTNQNYYLHVVEN